MSTPASPSSPSAWQRAVAQRLALALDRGLLMHAPVHDRTEDDDSSLRSRWRMPRTPAGSSPSPAVQALARLQAPDPAGRARAGSLMSRCLQHYREQIRADDEEDDAGVALACFLAACVQAQEGQAVTLSRWRAVLHWVEAWADEGLVWAAVPPAEQADFFERMASLAVAIGEWSVVASRQGPAAVRSAQLLARSSLEGQLGLELQALSAVVRAIPAPSKAAGDTSWGDAELPKAPTVPPEGKRL